MCGAKYPPCFITHPNIQNSRAQRLPHAVQILVLLLCTPHPTFRIKRCVIRKLAVLNKHSTTFSLRLYLLLPIFRTAKHTRYKLFCCAFLSPVRNLAFLARRQREAKNCRCHRLWCTAPLSRRQATPSVAIVIVSRRSRSGHNIRRNPRGLQGGMVCTSRKGIGRSVQATVLPNGAVKPTI